MASKSSGKPLIAGGRTLSKMVRGQKGSGGGGKKNKKAVWFQAGNDVDNLRGKVGSWPVGEMPAKLADRINKK